MRMELRRKAGFIHRITGREREAEQIDVGAAHARDRIGGLVRQFLTTGSVVGAAGFCSCLYCGESGEIACKTKGKISPLQIRGSRRVEEGRYRLPRGREFL
jgi:hypothetical protein